ncbi:hypothetical protein PF66_04228 [Pseudomonas asplenii]|uniref:Uncharacterized protein n=1 Tax=Pseudomonas asplenii TaxID=53407 RepID=A0A0M9GEU1_9PSED|nr:hypothetical protein [Pseudomonas fuscovaginae]KPA89376.1 hypothetical protein PF66_04228 [Pseudomonas fuscovaginae]
MINPRTKTEWLAYWQQHLDNHQSRLDNPEAHRIICLDISREMAAAQIIDPLEKLEMDEIANAAYWHAVETLIDCEPAFMTAGFYDLVPRHGGPAIGKISTMIYYPDATEEELGPWAAQVITENGTRRLVFRINAEVWDMNGLSVTRPDGSVYDLVLIGQRINGREYSNIDDPDAYRALADTAQIALENHDFGAYQRARPLLAAAAFTKCPTCMDRFALSDDCHKCKGRGFTRRKSY